MDDRTYADASTANGTAALDPMTAGHDEPPADASADPATASSGIASLRPAFLSELAGAMHAAAARERERIAAAMSDDAVTHVEKTRARAEIETQELRRLAGDDVSRIEDWSASETKRIKAEATQRIAERRANLDDYLRQHDAIIAAEVEAVEAAVTDYGATLDAFFAGLTDSNDPSEIVQIAEQLPTPPDLDAVRATARGDAVGRYADATDDTDTDTEDPDATGEGDLMATARADTTASESEPVAMADAAVADVDAASAEVVDTQVVAESAVESTTETPLEATADARVDATAAATADPADGWGRTPDSTATAIASQPAVGVMDPAASASDNGWGTDEPVTVGAPADHTSAAVRLLRSVAPWTAPSHDGEQRRPTDQG